MNSNNLNIIFLNLLKKQIGGSYLSNLDFMKDLHCIAGTKIQEILILDEIWETRRFHNSLNVKNRKILFYPTWDSKSIPNNDDIRKLSNFIKGTFNGNGYSKNVLVLGHESLLWVAPFFSNSGKIYKIITLHHGTPTHSLHELSDSFRHSFLSNLKAVNIAITVSDHLAKQILGFYDLLCMTIPNYPRIEVSKKIIQFNGRIRLIQISTFRKIKRPYDGIRICQNIKKKGIDVSLLIIGFGENSKELMLPNNLDIAVVPYLERTELSKHIAQSDFLILPSMNEGHPRVVVEAMQCGTPPVVSKGANKSNFVKHRKNGLVYEALNVFEAADLLIEYYLDAKKYISLIENGEISVENLYQEREQRLRKLIKGII
ncbi:MAG: glycosyltransferase family 4 protein [Desulfobacterales bacterium]|nr:glycosyltransferase family 4 protein [Desulfobacterales bacterium]